MRFWEDIKQIKQKLEDLKGATEEKNVKEFKKEKEELTKLLLQEEPF